MKRKPIRWKDHDIDVNPSGWSNWLFPRHKDHRIACCDCGLVHRIDFRVDARGKPLPTPDGGLLHRRHGHVMFRAARDNRSTASHRRYKEPTFNKTFLDHAAASLVALYAESPDQLDGFIRRLRQAVKQAKEKKYG